MPQKLGCVVERVVAHGERVYTLALRPERLVPRFRAGQFLHLALDPYDPSGFWPESRVFSIASPPAERNTVRITYAVHGRFTARMESDMVEGRQVWIKLPYGDFVVDSRSDVVLFAGGTGITAFTAFLEGLAAQTPAGHHSVTLAYGARTNSLLIYRDVVERCAERLPSLDVSYFVEHDVASARGTGAVDAWPGVGRRCLAAARTPVRHDVLHLGAPADAADHRRGPACPQHRSGGDPH